VRDEEQAKKIHPDETLRYDQNHASPDKEDPDMSVLHPHSKWRETI
jgi:hypothetical protein